MTKLRSCSSVPEYSLSDFKKANQLIKQQKENNWRTQKKPHFTLCDASDNWIVDFYKLKFKNNSSIMTNMRNTTVESTLGESRFRNYYE
jgi:hypothetical protein